jgi:serine/threonine protein kinase
MAIQVPLQRLGGRYQLQRRLGRGGVAVVHEGLDLWTGQRVALKVLYQETPLHVARLLLEAEVLRRLEHPHIVRLLDSGTEEERQVPFLVLERATTSLATVLREQGPLPAVRVAGLAVQILSALSAVHAQGIVHRDLKPGNLLLADDGRVMLADFGVAQVPGCGLDFPQRAVGSPSYMAPEQRRGERVGPRADLYALGCTLRKLATCPDALGPILERAMQPAPAARYDSAEEMARAIVHTLQDFAHCGRAEGVQDRTGRCAI